jgi:hypothetical protein
MEGASLASTMPLELDAGVEGTSSTVGISTAVGVVAPRRPFRISRFVGGEDGA